MRLFHVLIAVFACTSNLHAQAMTTAEAFEKSLKYKDGTVDIASGLATLNLPTEYHYLDPAQSKAVLVTAWGNPPSAAEGVLGMIFPSDSSPLDEDGWAVVISYEEDGYVSDKDAEKINYSDLLEQLQESSKANNAERIKQGYESVDVVGWAEQPNYDREAHKMYWAKELEFNHQPKHGLNYDVRVLGRKGVLVLSAVSSMEQISAIREGMTKVISTIDFNSGNRYADFVPGKDKMAEYGLAALVLGGVAAAAKVGLFKWLIAGIIAFKKIIIIGLIAVFAFVRKILSGRRANAAPASSAATPPRVPPKAG